MSPTKLNIILSWRFLLRWVGSCFALVGIVFVFIRLHSYWLELDLFRIDTSSWGGVALFSVIYACANIFLTFAWWHLLCFLNVKTTRVEALRIYGLSQLAKYMPGNIFHLAGRQALGMAASMPTGALAKSMIWEHGLIAVAGALFGWLALPRLMPGFSEWAGLLLLLVSIYLVSSLLVKIAGRHTMWSFWWQMAFLVVSGGVFIALLNMVVVEGGIATTDWPIVGGAYICAWLIGMVTPGAPAGVGVRELILLLLLKGLVAETDLLLTVLLGRLITVVGDLLFFAVAFILSVKRQNNQNNYA